MKAPRTAHTLLDFTHALNALRAQEAAQHPAPVQEFAVFVADTGTMHAVPVTTAGQRHAPEGRHELMRYYGSEAGRVLDTHEAAHAWALYQKDTEAQVCVMSGDPAELATVREMLAPLNLPAAAFMLATPEAVAAAPLFAQLYASSVNPATTEALRHRIEQGGHVKPMYALTRTVRP